MNRIAFCLPGDGVWTGGVNYVETVCHALLAHPEFRFEPVVFCSPRAAAALQSRFEALLGSHLVRDPYLARGRRAGLMSAVLLGTNRHMSAIGCDHDCDVLLEAADFFGWRFPIASLAWVPDFQDRHLPHLFSRAGLYRKWLGLRMQLAAGRPVLLSSEDARKDCERFYPASRGRTVVARFAVRPALAPGESDGRVLEKYGLPERFFYLPNQFWVHKNHAGVIEALRICRDRGVNVIVAASGNPQDPRHAGHYDRLQERVAALGLTDELRFLGNVPFRDVALLMRAALAMLNPSLFEGWSTTVEEAKSLGARLVVSDLAVHREQLGSSAAFFDPRDPQAIAASLEKIWSEVRVPPTLQEQQSAATAAEIRIREFAQAFAQACEVALDRFRPRAGSHV